VPDLEYLPGVARSSRPAPGGGWEPLRRGTGVVEPFARMARTHAASAAGDALVAVGLAGSLFFSITPDAARGRVALYLLLTMAPFALVAPFLGPLIDRNSGGRRHMVVGSLVARAVLCLLMVAYLDSLFLFPLAFGTLVMGKAYGVARASLVPVLVADERELVQANSKLTLVSGIAGFLAGAPGAGLLQIGAELVLLVGAIVFGVGAVLALQLPAARASAPTTARERAELRAPGVFLAASAMAVLRGAVGFLAFLLAFSLRAEDAPAWWFGIVLSASAVGALLGAAIAPFVRRWVREERILLGSLVAVSVGGVAGIQIGGRASAALLGLFVGIAASAGRLCFDAIVQRDAPEADQARSFARFETRFQLAWVLGGFVPVVLSIPRTAGYAVLAVVTTVAAASYATGRSRPWERWR
jgi:MFS family permease